MALSLRSFPRPLLVTNGALEIVEYSSHLLNLLGLPESETGQDHDALTQFVAGDEELGDNLALATARLTLPGDEESLSWTWRERTYDVTVTALEESDQFLVVLDDVTEHVMTAEIQLNARHYLEHILGDISVGVAVLNEQLRITSINRHMLGLVTNAGRNLDLVDAIGSSARESLPADWGTQVQELSADVLATGERSPEVNMPLRPKAQGGAARNGSSSPPP